MVVRVSSFSLHRYFSLDIAASYFLNQALSQQIYQFCKKKLLQKICLPLNYDKTQEIPQNIG